MPLIEDAIAAYEATARMVSRLLDSRVDLLSSGVAAMSNQPSMHFSGGYKDVSGVLGVCLPAESRATMSRVAAESPASSVPAVEVLTVDIDWMTFEGWITIPDARTCFVEVDFQAHRRVTGDVFERSISSDGAVNDSTPVEWQLPLDGPAVLEVPLTASTQGRRKIVIHLRHPPERMVLRRLAITALP